MRLAHVPTDTIAKMIGVQVVRRTSQKRERETGLEKRNAAQEKKQLFEWRQSRPHEIGGNFDFRRLKYIFDLEYEASLLVLPHPPHSLVLIRPIISLSLSLSLSFKAAKMTTSNDDYDGTTSADDHSERRRSRVEVCHVYYAKLISPLKGCAIFTQPFLEKTFLLFRDFRLILALD